MLDRARFQGLLEHFRSTEKCLVAESFFTLLTVYCFSNTLQPSFESLCFNKHTLPRRHSDSNWPQWIYLCPWHMHMFFMMIHLLQVSTIKDFNTKTFTHCHVAMLNITIMHLKRPIHYIFSICNICQVGYIHIVKLILSKSYEINQNIYMPLTWWFNNYAYTSGGMSANTTLSFCSWNRQMKINIP